MPLSSLSFRLILVRCLLATTMACPLQAQENSIFDRYFTAEPLEFRNAGRTAGSLQFRFQDSRGFIWGADENYTLLRFDGQNIETFENKPGDPTTASPGILWDISSRFFEDSEGKIWITYSASSNIDCYDPSTEQFRQFLPILSAAAGGSDSGYARMVFEDSKGYIWIGTDRGLFRYSKQTDSIRHFNYPYLLTIILEDWEQNIWIHLRDEFLAKINRETGAIEEKVIIPKGLASNNWNKNALDHCCRLKNNATHLLVISGKLYEFDSKKRNIAVMHKGLLPSEDDIYSFWAKNDLILLGTRSGLFLQYHPQNRIFTQSALFKPGEQDDNHKFSFPLNIFQSADGIIWANVYQRRESLPQNAQIFPKKLPVFSVKLPDEINALNRDHDSGDYFFLLDGEAWFFTQPYLTPMLPGARKKKKINLSVPGVAEQWSLTYQFETDRNGNLWQAATPKSGSGILYLRYYDKHGKCLNSHTVNTGNQGFPGGIVQDIKSDSDGNIWIASTKGLCCFRPGYSSFKDCSAGLETESRNIFTLMVDKQGNIWCGRHSQVSKLNPQNETWTHYSGGTLRLSGEANALHEDRSGRIWFGMNGGLFALERDNKMPKQYGKADGFFGGRVYTIFEGSSGQLWITSPYGFYLYDEGRDRFSLFGIKEGVITLEIDRKNAYKKDKHGTVFIQTTYSEFYFLKPEKVETDTLLPRLYLTGLQLFNEKVKTSADGILQKSLYFTDEIKLKYRQNDFTIHYTAPEYTYPEKLEFFVQMQGFNDDWQNLGNKREVRFTNLSPGTYTFKVKVRNHHGFWSDTPRTLQIVVLPPWYRTWWAYLLYVLTMGGILFAIRNYELKRQLAKAEAHRLQELDLAKSRLYTNITHEFRTPLTVILGMADQMKSDPKNWFNEGLHLIRRNGKQLLNLVNQLLDLSKLESGNMPLNLVQGDIVNYLKYLTESFHSYADSKDIRLHFASDFKELLMDYDPEKVQHILSNLLSNAIKFTPAGGDVYLDVRRPKDNDDAVLLQVRDNGPGISPEHLPRIFDRFYQADSTSTRKGEGTGIGLAMVKELVKLMGGEIGVESEAGKGAKFMILLPVKQSAQKAETENAEVPIPIVAQTILLENEPAQSAPDVPHSELPLVLLIEDNADVITYLTSFLSGDYRVATATNGQQGIEKAIELTPDLVVSDVMMPEKDGFEVCATLKTDERTSHIPVILLTAKAGPAAKLEGLTHGADAYLAKPFNKEELLVRMEKLIELRRRLQERYAGHDIFFKNVIAENPTPEDLFLQKLVTIVERNLSDEHFGLPDLCRQAGMSRSQLFRKLKALTGKSTTHFIRSIRLAKGRELLESSDMTVSEVAYSTGFSNLAYFSTMFREEFGIPPSNLKK
mgnify:CR=1 FL=1